jgi:hypothetical protein
MKDRYDKHKSRRNRATIREIFMREWDPIGVRDVPEAQDEYDSYAAEACAMLIDRGATAADLEQYLLLIEAEHMGLGQRADAGPRARRTAEALVSLLPTLTD